ncbi:hypothetical protein Sp14A_05290 [Streptococcus pluranimalium]|uniref:Uncharacterized protein n=1 Tax=Streptococcus pluranimalium TaxID=82348 RepID=A0A345VIA7_9STRE|nr:hypothetical protein Sp14A_05290 [Streptococcus pluranimalium]
MMKHNGHNNEAGFVALLSQKQLQDKLSSWLEN